MTTQTDEGADDPDHGAAAPAAVDDGRACVGGEPHSFDSVQHWLIDEAVLDLLANSHAWNSWTTNPRRPPNGNGHPADIYGPDGAFYLEPHSSREELEWALMENHGGGVPVDVIHALVDAARVVGTRARAISQVVASIAMLERELGHPVSRKPLREAIWFWWNVPRFDKVPKARSKYPLTLRWSPAAWQAHSDRSVGLVIEHVTPLGGHIEQLLDASSDELRIRSILHAIEFAVITKDEDDQITRAGWRNKTAPGDGNTDQRYTESGLDPQTFIVPVDLADVVQVAE